VTRGRGRGDGRHLKPITIGDVAAHAAVSIATVSRVLNGAATVNPALVARVKASCAELSYQPSQAARSLAGRPSSIIGLLVTDIQNPFFMEIARGVEDMASQHGYLVVLCNTGEDARKERRYIEALCAEDIGGAIVVPTFEQQASLQTFLAHGIPLVAVDRRIAIDTVDAVLIDNVAAAYDAVSHLIANGYRRIGVVTGTSTSTTGRDRLRGYQGALRDAGLPRDPLLERQGAFRQDVAEQLTGQLLQAVPDIDALFTATNRLTMGALRAIQTRGLSIPDDLGLVGFDEVPWVTPGSCPLTTVAQPSYEIGAAAASRLMHRMQHPEGAVRQEIVLAHRLIVRESSRPARRGAMS
jgi:LacI family transcriptional regulator